MQEILCMLIGAVIAIFTSFAVPEKYQKKIYLRILSSLCNNLCNIKVRFI